MISHAEYAALNPMPYFGAASIHVQIEAYLNQQEWLPEPSKVRRPRQSKEDLRRDKCKARYKSQFANGPVTVAQMAKSMRIERQSVRLKLREYSALGYIQRLPNNFYDWIEQNAD